MAKVLEVACQANPEVRETLLRLASQGVSHEKIARELYGEHGVETGRNGVASWLSDNEAEIAAWLRANVTE